MDNVRKHGKEEVFQQQGNLSEFYCPLLISDGPFPFNWGFRIGWLRTTTTVKHATVHDQNHVTVHFSRIVLRMRYIVELFRVVATTENILLVFSRLGNSRISSFRFNLL